MAQPSSFEGSVIDSRVIESTPHSQDTQRLGVWFLILSLLLATLVLVGGFVRVSGSGLSIPEWPLIQGSLLPPFSRQGWQEVYKTYYREIHNLELTGSYDDKGLPSQPLSLNKTERLTPTPTSSPELLSLKRFQWMFAIEYMHRFVAALVSLVFLVLSVQIWRREKLRQRFGGRTIGLALLLFSQAVLGGIVVKYDLKADAVALHLGIAFVFFGWILWTAFQLLFTTPLALRQAPQTQWLRRLSWMALAAVYLQVLSGGLVAGTHAGYIFNQWPMMGQSMVPASELLWNSQLKPVWLNLLENQVLLQFFHRWWAIAAAMAVFVLLFSSLKAQIRGEVSSRCRFGLRALASLVVTQILLGIMTLIAVVPATLALLHLMIALLLFAVLLLVAYELR